MLKHNESDQFVKPPSIHRRHIITLSTLPASARTYWIVRAFLVALATCLVAVGVVVAFSWPFPVQAIVAVVAAILAVDAVLIPLRHAWYRYSVTPEEFHISRGRFLLHTTTVAVPNILHAEVSQGPLLRLFGLVEVRIKLVVGDHELGPVSPLEAERIRQTILHSAGRRGDDS